MQEKQRFLTISEAAEFLHVSEVSLRRWTNSGKLRCFRVGGRNERRFLVEDLLAFMPSEVIQPEQQVDETEAAGENTTDYTERHISLFFRDAEEQWQLFRPYIIDHLNAGEPAIYLQHSTSSEQLMQRLHAEGLPLDKLIARGLLRVLPPTQSYLLPGRFDAQYMLDFIETAIQAAQEAGHKRILMTGEMTWSLQGTPGAEEMATYEAQLNPLVDKYPSVTIVCQYDLKRFAGDLILDALLTHPSILVANGHAAGFYGL
ncbi:MAG TPA: MEDS domain-containing protein [Ktedonobacteraceae bacterium]|nr:MEDS domain-containing protein [Ktedonobacteraceae bacterium]